MMQKTFHQNFDIVYSACKKALKSLGMNIEYDNMRNGSMSASTQSSIWSWGESIDISVSKDKGKILVKVKSDHKAQLFDLGGKNEKNEENILNEVAKILNK
jgi:hypothetical protein